MSIKIKSKPLNKPLFFNFEIFDPPIIFSSLFLRISLFEGNIESFNRDAATAATGSEIVLKFSRGVLDSNGEATAGIHVGALEGFYNSSVHGIKYQINVFL